MTEDTIRPARKIPLRTGLIAAALLAVGAGGGATLAHRMPNVEMAPTSPVAIRSLAESDDVVTVRGKVAEVYGPAFILADGSGRALVEAGRRRGWLGGDTALVAVGQTVSVQGRFRGGALHASFLVGADGKVTALHGGPHGGREGHRHGGPREPEGRELDDAGPPPPAAAPAAEPAAPLPAAGGSTAG